MKWEWEELAICFFVIWKKHKIPMRRGEFQIRIFRCKQFLWHRHLFPHWQSYTCYCTMEESFTRNHLAHFHGPCILPVFTDQSRHICTKSKWLSRSCLNHAANCIANLICYLFFQIVAPQNQSPFLMIRAHKLPPYCVLILYVENGKSTLFFNQRVQCSST